VSWKEKGVGSRFCTETTPDPFFPDPFFFFASLRGPKGRHNLAVLYQEQQRLAGAEVQWRAALAEQPGFVPAWQGLGELYLTQRRWPELDEVVGRVAGLPAGEMEAAVLRGRTHLAREEFGPAREVLEATMARHAGALWPRVLLTHVRLREGKDWEAAERALRAVLAVDPEHAEAQHNLRLPRCRLRREAVLA
jgi:hypothetical protein